MKTCAIALTLLLPFSTAFAESAAVKECKLILAEGKYVLADYVDAKESARAADFFSHSTVPGVSGNANASSRRAHERIEKLEDELRGIQRQLIRHDCENVLGVG